MERKRKCYKQRLHFGQMPRVGEKGQWGWGWGVRSAGESTSFCFFVLSVESFVKLWWQYWKKIDCPVYLLSQSPLPQHSTKNKY